MRIRTRPLVALASLVVAAVVVHGQVPAPPPWAYGFTSAGPDPVAPPCATASKPLDCARMQAPRPTDGLLKLTGSDLTFTERQVHFDYGPADWYPGDHPPMPDIVARGRESDTLRACGLCHYPNGKGRQENAGISGLPVSYFIQQMNDFASGARKSAEPRKNNTNIMIAIAKALTADGHAVMRSSGVFRRGPLLPETVHDHELQLPGMPAPGQRRGGHRHETT